MRFASLCVAMAAAVAMPLAAPAIGAALPAADSADLAPPAPGLTVERIVMVYRHGLRAPLDTEIGAASYARQPWPAWATPNALLTPHGREGMRLLGRYDRSLFTSLGLLAAQGCPDERNIEIYTDSDSRSIASGDELREGLAPGCQIATLHKAPDTPDLTFTANAPGAAPFDGDTALASINAYTHGGPGALIAPYRAQIGELEKILGCRAADDQAGCGIADIPSRLTADRNGLRLEGPIDVTSGTAEVFLLEYAEGMPMADVGWGRAGIGKLTEISRLHALLFDIYDRAPYMARRTAAELGPRVRALLTDAAGPKVMMFVGHDNNIAALASLLGATFQIPSYGREDPPIGGALGFELLADAKDGQRYVRVFYQAQTLDQLRDLSPLTLATPPATQILSPRCAQGPARLCSADALAALLTWPGQRPLSQPENRP